jgi:hypothetical protein
MVARTQIKAVATTIVLATIDIEIKIGNIPEKIIVVRRLINKMLAYSAMKISANIPPLYSTLNPDTNSDSPSAKSNGERFVSARLVINQHKNMVGIISIPQE